jgi:enoyl-CoA hydratase
MRRSADNAAMVENDVSEHCYSIWTTHDERRPVSELVNYHLEGAIATIAMDDGKVNAFSLEMLSALHEAFDRAEHDGAVVLLRGRDGYFSAGFDLQVFAGGDAERIVEMLRLGATLTQRIMSFPAPVLIASDGHAVAAGAFMLMAADVRIGVDGEFRVGLNEVQIGLTMPQFVIELARQRLHPGHLAHAVIDAAMYTPREAVHVGYLDKVVPAAELGEAAQREAERLAGLNRVAHAATKQRVRSPSLAAIGAAIEDEINVAALSGASAPA